MFSGGWQKVFFFPNMYFSERLCKTLFVFGRGEKGIFTNTICFTNIALLGTGETKNHLSWKRVFWERGLLTISDSQKLCLLKHTYMVSSVKLSFCREKGASCKETENLPKIVDCVCANIQKVFFSLGGLLQVWFGVAGCMVFVFYCAFVVLCHCSYCYSCFNKKQPKVTNNCPKIESISGPRLGQYLVQAYCIGVNLRQSLGMFLLNLIFLAERRCLTNRKEKHKTSGHLTRP